MSTQTINVSSIVIYLFNYTTFDVPYRFCKLYTWSVNIIITIIIIITVLGNGREWCAGCLLLKSGVYGKLFGRIVGGERVSVGDVVEGMVKGGGSPHHSHLGFAHHLRSQFHQSAPLQRESLSQAILLGLAFLDLFVHPNQQLAAKLVKPRA